MIDIMSINERPQKTNKLAEIIAVLGLLFAESGAGEDNSSTIEALTRLGQKQEHLHEMTIKELEETIEALNKGLDDFFKTEESLKKEQRELTEKLKEVGEEEDNHKRITESLRILEEIDLLKKRISALDKSSRRLYELHKYYEKLLMEKAVDRIEEIAIGPTELT